MYCDKKNKYELQLLQYASNIAQINIFTNLAS